MMNPTPDASTAADNDGSLDPQQAAALLRQTTQQARRQLAPYPPWLSVLRGAIILVACGVVWLTVRGQHPYVGPPVPAVFAVVVTSVVVHLGVTLTVAKRATDGVSGRSRLRGPEMAVMAVIWVGVYVVMGVLAGVGVRPAIVYGVYPSSAPLVLAGLAWAILMAIRANWRRSRMALAIAVVGAAAAFAGPVATWLVSGAGVCVVLLVNAAISARQERV